MKRAFWAVVGWIEASRWRFYIAFWFALMGAFPIAPFNASHKSLSPWLLALDLACHGFGVWLELRQFRKKWSVEIVIERRHPEEGSSQWN